MNTLFTDYNANTKKAINTIQYLITDVDNKINNLNFVKDCMIDKLINEIHSISTYPFSYTERFYSAVLAYINRKEKPLPKTKEERKEKFGYDPKTCYEILLESIQDIFPSVTKIDKIIWRGFDSHGVCIYFNIMDEISKNRYDEHTYYLYIPIINNISRNDVTWDNGYIDYDIVKFQLYKQTGENSWTRVYNSYEISKELIDMSKENKDGRDN